MIVRSNFNKIKPSTQKAQSKPTGSAQVNFHGKNADSVGMPSAKHYAGLMLSFKGSSPDIDTLKESFQEMTLRERKSKINSAIISEDKSKQKEISAILRDEIPNSDGDRKVSIIDSLFELTRSDDDSRSVLDENDKLANLKAITDCLDDNNSYVKCHAARALNELSSTILEIDKDNSFKVNLIKRLKECEKQMAPSTEDYTETSKDKEEFLKDSHQLQDRLSEGSSGST